MPPRLTRTAATTAPPASAARAMRSTTTSGVDRVVVRDSVRIERAYLASLLADQIRPHHLVVLVVEDVAVPHIPRSTARRIERELVDTGRDLVHGGRRRRPPDRD